jgi:neutral ceramidase
VSSSPCEELQALPPTNYAASPVVEINLMGYADPDQLGSGLRQRLYCRAFIVGSSASPLDRFVYIVLDTQSGDTAIRDGILRGLSDLGREYSVYTKDNVAITGTHSHSGPGAWLNYLLPQITSKGFDKQSYQAIVDGSVRAIEQAHKRLAPGYLRIGSLEVEGININRSPYAYSKNPETERAKYNSDVDKSITVLSFERAADKQPMGMLSWFPVHGTSLYGNNTLITGDNKGVAAHLFESSLRHKNPDFVAGFSQSNVGDTSPNILGSFCESSGLQCRFNDSTCDGKTQGCHGRGPFFQYPDQGTRSCFEIGRRQYQAAKSVFDSPTLRRLPGASVVSSFHTYANLSSYTFVSPLDASRVVTTCSAALGYGFAGGTTDGPGAFDFRQGTNDSDDNSPALKNPLWRVVRNFIHDPSDEQIVCQHPKPILLDVGATIRPYSWTPNIVDIQLLRVGPLIIIVAPGEATTMSGRRWRNSLAAAAPSVLDMEDPVVVLGGPANTYAHYIATAEEYGVQRYEGASTLYGPHTLEAYINLTLTNLPYLGTKSEIAKLPTLPAGPSPPINVNSSLSFITPVIVDAPSFFKSFGDVLSSPSSSKIYYPGDVPVTTFVGANPRNNLRPFGTFAAIEKLDGRSWITVRTDEDWHLVYRWKRTSTVLGTSEVTVEWEIEDEVDDGVYRMHYYGDARSLGGSVTAFEGIGSEFTVRAVHLRRTVNTAVAKTSI